MILCSRSVHNFIWLFFSEGKWFHLSPSWTHLRFWISEKAEEGLNSHLGAPFPLPLLLPEDLMPHWLPVNCHFRGYCGLEQNDIAFHWLSLFGGGMLGRDCYRNCCLSLSLLLTFLPCKADLCSSAAEGGRLVPSRPKLCSEVYMRAWNRFFITPAPISVLCSLIAWEISYRWEGSPT